MADTHSKLMGLLVRCPYVACADTDRQYAVNWLMNNGVTVQKWIPVTERLPEKDGKYLVFEQHGGSTITAALRFTKDARKISRYDFGRRGKNVWYDYDSEWGYFAVNSVTHWMPLPEPPKEGIE